MVLSACIMVAAELEVVAAGATDKMRGRHSIGGGACVSYHVVVVKPMIVEYIALHLFFPIHWSRWNSGSLYH